MSGTGTGETAEAHLQQMHYMPEDEILLFVKLAPLVLKERAEKHKQYAHDAESALAKLGL